LKKINTNSQGRLLKNLFIIFVLLKPFIAVSDSLHGKAFEITKKDCKRIVVDIKEKKIIEKNMPSTIKYLCYRYKNNFECSVIESGKEFMINQCTYEKKKNYKRIYCDDLEEEYLLFNDSNIAVIRGKRNLQDISNYGFDICRAEYSNTKKVFKN
jgi:hypothetical protein